MTATRTESDTLGQSGQNLLRILVASYFIGVSIGLIDGTRATALITLFLPPGPADRFAAAMVFVLAYLVLTGLWLRPAALLLGLVIFWSSIITHVVQSTVINIGDFWRDLTLISALMLTYVQASPRIARRRSLWRRIPRARRLRPAEAVSPRRVVSQSALAAERLRPETEPVVPLHPRWLRGRTQESMPDNIFAEERSDAVAS